MKIVNLEQGSSDWLQWRRIGITSSDAGHLMGNAPWNDPVKLREQKLGRRGEDPVNDAMRRGTEMEPHVRLMFQQLTGLRVRPVCVVHEKYEWLKASLDGLSEDGKTVVEIKCPKKPKAHLTALKGKPPDYYVHQLQHHLLVTGAERVCYVSYHPDFKPYQRLKIVNVTPDVEYQQLLFKKERDFWLSLGLRAGNNRP